MEGLFYEALPGGSHVTRLNFKKSRVDVKNASCCCWKLKKHSPSLLEF